MSKLILSITIIALGCVQLSAFAQGDFTVDNPCLKRASSQPQTI